MKLHLALATAGCLALAGCATSSDHITAMYSSPMKYGAYACPQLAAEDEELRSRVSLLGGQLNRRATNDKVAMGVAIVAFWPAAFFIKGDGEQAAEYARLKGDHEAVLQAAQARGCMLGAPAPVPAAVVQAAPSYTPPIAVAQAQPAPLRPIPASPQPLATYYMAARAAESELRPYEPRRVPAAETPGVVVISDYGRDPR